MEGERGEGVGSGERRAESGAALLEELKRPLARRLFAVYRAIRDGVPAPDVAQATGMDPWFLAQLAEIAEVERKLSLLELPTPAVTELHEELSDPHLTSELPLLPGEGWGEVSALLRQAKQLGFADSHLARLVSFPVPLEGDAAAEGV